MMEIQLIDNRVDSEKGSAQGGHAYRYLNQLLQVEGTKWTPSPQRFCTFAPNPLKYISQRQNYLRKYRTCKCIHILQLDEYYKSPHLFRSLKKYGTKIIATMHHYPTSAVRGLLLKWSSKYIDVIVVHSTFIKKTLEQLGVRCDVEVINYPVFDVSIANSVINDCLYDRKDKFTFLCIGDTRIDKGLNVLIEAFQYLSENVKRDCRFVVAGKERDIHYQDLEDASKRFGIEVYTEPGFVEDKRYWELIYGSDYILLPYTKLFTGASGPLTDGVYAFKRILGCDFGNIGETIKNNDLGATFVTEDSRSLAESISEIITGEWEPTDRYKSYRESLAIQSFEASYLRLYKEYC